MNTYRTDIEIPISSCNITYKDKTMFLGSCFVDYIGRVMSEHRFNVCLNPFGILYNPMSISSACKRILTPTPFVEKELFFYDGLYHSLMHHGRFSDLSTADCLARINDSLSTAATYLREASCLIITFGTAYVYLLKGNGQVVANCHKLPARFFERRRLTVDEITSEWSALLECLWQINPTLKIILTVSPIRHLKEGAHLNQISKAILILAVQTLSERYADRLSYFPAYELMMDELRDYRFYADDMTHPSQKAINHIWNRFCDTCMDAETKAILKEITAINKAMAHRPLYPTTVAYSLFLKQLALKINHLNERYPYIDLPAELLDSTTVFNQE